MATSYTSIFTSGVRPTTVDLGGILFIANGREWMRCSPDGSNLYWANACYPIDNDYERSEPASGDGGAGNLTGDYRHYYAWYNDALGYYSMPSGPSASAGDSGVFTTVAAKNIVVGAASAGDGALHEPSYTYYVTTSGFGMLNSFGAMDDSNAPFNGIASAQLFRNVNGAASNSDLVNNDDRIPYFAIPARWEGWEATGGGDWDQTDSYVDGILDFTNQLNYGAMPPPLCRYIWKHQGRLCGVGFDPFALQQPIKLDYSESNSYRSGDYRYVFLRGSTTDRGLPDGFSPWTPNLSLEILSGTLAGQKWDAIFCEDTGGGPTAPWNYPIKTNFAYRAANDGEYSARVIDRFAGSFYYSQPGLPFYWGDPVAGVLNQEPYRLFQGDKPVGGASSGSANLVLGQYSTSVSVNIGTDTIPQWRTFSIPSGSISHWAAVNIPGKGLVTLSPDGPNYYRPPTKEDIEGGFAGEWLPLDAMEGTGHRRCRKIFKDIIDVDDPTYCGGVYDPRTKTVEWTFSTLDRDTGHHGDFQLRYDTTTGDFFPVDGRNKNCYCIGFESGKAVLVHGDDWGVLHKDYETQYDGNTDIDETDSSKTSIRTISAATDNLSCPNYSEANGYRVTYSGDGLGTFPIGVGTRVYAVYVSGGDDIVDRDDWRYVIDVDSSSNYLYLDRQRGWAETSYTHSDDSSETYPEKILVSGIHAYCDSKAVQSAMRNGTNVRLLPLSDSTGYVQASYYHHGDSSQVKDETDKFEAPTITGRQKEVFKFSGSVGTGATVQCRLFSIGAGYKFACKEISVKYTNLEDEM